MNNLADRIGDTRQLMQDMGKLFIARTEKKWEIRGSGKEYQGVKWPELAKSTTMRIVSKTGKKRRGKDHMLIDTGGMHAALTWTAKERETKIFFLPPEAQKYYWHHFGMGNLPRRVVLDITKEDEKALDRETNRFIKETLEAKR